PRRRPGGRGVGRPCRDGSAGMVGGCGRGRGGCGVDYGERGRAWIRSCRSAVSWPGIRRAPSGAAGGAWAGAGRFRRRGAGVVGGAGAFPFTLTVPGGRVRAAGVTVVGVLPTHRRRGVLRSMMRAQLDACREHGEPVAYLWATEDTIYGRFGYGVASYSLEVDIPRERSAYYAPAPSVGHARLVPLGAAEPLVAPVWERVAAVTPGMFARPSAWWQARALADPDWRRRGGGDLQCVVLEVGGRATAYALYRINAGSDRGVQVGSLDVVEAMGDAPKPREPSGGSCSTST